MGGELVIAALAADQIEAAVELWRDAGLTRPWNDPVADARLALSSPSSTILGGYVERRLVATAMVGFDGHRAWVYYLAIRDAFRAHGNGRRMMDACEAWALSVGAPKIQLMVRSDNAAAVGFYQALGYGADAVSVMSKRF